MSSCSVVLWTTTAPFFPKFKELCPSYFSFPTSLHPLNSNKSVHHLSHPPCHFLGGLNIQITFSVLPFGTFLPLAQVLLLLSSICVCLEKFVIANALIHLHGTRRSAFHEGILQGAIYVGVFSHCSRRISQALSIHALFCSAVHALIQYVPA